MSGTEITSGDFLQGVPQDTAHLRERIDWPYLVNFGILRLFSIMSEKEVYPYENIDNLTKFLERLIPSFYRVQDPKYQEAITKGTHTVKVDIRPTFCGARISYEVCEREGIPHTEEIEEIDPVDRFGAIIDLFQRLNALLKLDRVEVFTGETWEDYQERVSEAVEAAKETQDNEPKPGITP